MTAATIIAPAPAAPDRAEALPSTIHPPPSTSPRRRRLRFAVGSGGPLFAVVSILIFAAAANTQANLLFWALGLLVGGLAVSALWAWASLRSVTVTRLAPAHAVEGQPMLLRYRVENHGWLPVFGLVVRERFADRARRGAGPAGGRLTAAPTGWLRHLPPGQTGQAQAHGWPTRRGALKLEAIELRTAFPFALITRVLRVHEPQRVLVLPGMARVKRGVLHAARQAAGTGMDRLQRPGGQDELYGVRPYRRGDPLKLIDWKRTARSGKLIAREFSRTTPPRMHVLLELREPAAAGPAADEDAIRLAASLVCEGYLQGFEVGLSVNGPAAPTLPPGRSPAHRRALLEALGALDLHRRSHRPPPRSAPPPSVIVRAGAGAGTPFGRTRGGGIPGPLVLGGDDLHTLLAGPLADDDAVAWLERVMTGGTRGDAAGPPTNLNAHAASAAVSPSSGGGGA